jgi:D-alanyl-D-alanine carboxypeptidase/D-alanyl-D-alanine-endopeptidase (penicillin-binding protein 4)
MSKLLAYSSNYIANQVLITFGIKTHGPPGTLDNAVETPSEYAQPGLDLNGVMRRGVLSSEAHGDLPPEAP